MLQIQSQQPSRQLYLSLTLGSNLLKGLAMKRFAGLLMVLVASSQIHAAEIGFLETYVLSPDRQQALEQLLPGTEDYYYYHCLHHQQLEQYEKVDQLLAEWVKRFRYTARVREILNRQALLAFDADPNKTTEYLRTQLKLKFDHQKTTRAAERLLPNSLDPKLIATERLDQIGFSQKRNLDQFENKALRRLSSLELNPEQRRALLSRLQNPDTPNIVDHVIADIAHFRGTSFGALPIHRLLLIEQLDACLAKRPQLINDGNFVNTYLVRLHPREGLDWRHDPAELRSYLDRLQKFAEKLPAAQNSLKAHVLYHRLRLDRSEGQYDREQFEAYLSLPRSASYVSPRYLESLRGRQPMANLSANFSATTQLSPVGNDEPLVRSYLSHFFETDKTFEKFTKLLRDTYVSTVFAETKLVLGLGDEKEWYTMLTPAQLQALRDRVDIDFAFTNRNQFEVEKPVAVETFVKNVRTLIVKVYELNTRNYYARNGKEIDTDINLDGLVPNWEYTHEYKEAPLRRVNRKFTFPELNRRGVYVIDFIGSGQSSRIVVRKGHMQLLPRIAAAGVALKVIDENNEPRPNARIWMDGRDWMPDKNGEILLPFSTQPGQRKVVVIDGQFASLARINHPPEQYTLHAGFYVNREALLPQEEAELVIRPALLLNGVPVSMKILEDVGVKITTTDLDGTQTFREFDDIKLSSSVETSLKFQVPNRIGSIQIALDATAKQLSTGTDVLLQANDTIGINEIDTSLEIEDAHLARTTNGYRIDVLGKSGESRQHRPVRVELKHGEYKSTVSVMLQSGEIGSIALGSLDGINRVTAKLPSGRTRVWWLPKDARLHRRNVNAASGKPIEIPLSTLNSEDAQDVSFFELRAGSPFTSHKKKVSFKDGLALVGGLNAGDYRLLLHGSQESFDIRVEDATVADHYLLGKHRFLETMPSQSLNLMPVSTTKSDVVVKVGNASKTTRVHVFATRFEPTLKAFPGLAKIPFREPVRRTFGTRVSNFLTGRKIGDEYQYIIDRRYALKFPGNPLDRPSLLLNPWSVRSTSTGVQTAATGDDFAPDAEMPAPNEAGGAAQGRSGQAGTDSSNLDFLDEAGMSFLNLSLDKNGTVRIKREMLGDLQTVHVVAVDTDCLAYRSKALPAVEAEYRDLRLARILKTDEHFAQLKETDVFASGDTFKVDDLGTSRFEIYDNLTKIYQLMALEVADEKFEEFEFVTRWPKLSDDEKRENYTKYACHELHVFLFKKDRKFFDRVVRPYLANKKNKTVVDHWLLENSVQSYMDPWSYSRLNTAEKILISHALGDERARTRRHIKDQFDVIPPDREQLLALFNTALQSSDLEMAGSGEAGGVGGMGGGGGGFGGRGFGNRASGPESGAEAPSDSPALMDGFAAPAAPRPTSAPRGGNARRKSEAKNKYSESLEREGLMLGRESVDKAADFAKRGRYQKLYQALDKTKEWAENNYYKLELASLSPGLIPVNGFWNDLAQYDGKGPFLSAHFLEATGNRHEALLALALLDVPFKANEHDQEIEAPRLALKAGSPMIVFHEQIRPAEAETEESPVLISQHFFQANDRYRTVEGIRRDKFVTDEFLIHTVYGCQVVITNPSSAQQRLDVLTQIPAGAMPVSRGLYARSRPVDLAPFHTESVEFYFYFPHAGDFLHYPVHVSRNEKFLVAADPFKFHVVEEPSYIDQQSWEFVSQEGSDEDVLKFLKTQNLQEVALNRIAFRMRDQEFFEAVTEILRDRHEYDGTLWSYAVHHANRIGMREFLRHQDRFLAASGTLLTSSLINIDPVERRTYEHLDYRPLVNARAHQLGQKRQILNDRLHAQYHRLLKNLSYKRRMNDAERLEVASYLMLQDRIEDSISHFQQINPDQLQTRLQYDYTAAYLDLFNDQPELAGDITARYLNYPVDRWQKRFAAINAYLRDIEQGTNTLVDADDRTQQQAKLAANEPSFDFVVQDRKLVLNYRNISEVEINYYLMDVELLFSRNPFVATDAEQFAQLKANHTAVAKLKAKGKQQSIAIPEELQSSNILVEINTKGVSRSVAYFANTLDVQVAQSFGQLQVTQRDNQRPIRKAYVKVYARTNNGQTVFFKDGYTDLLGRFDYTSLSTNELDRVQKFSILVMSDDHGAIVKEATPPRR